MAPGEVLSTLNIQLAQAHLQIAANSEPMNLGTKQMMRNLVCGNTARTASALLLTMLAATACGGSGNGNGMNANANANAPLLPSNRNNNDVQRNADNSLIPENAGPTISGTPGSQVVVNTSYSFMPSASDLDGDSLTFTIANAPGWATFNTGTGRLTGTPSETDIGLSRDIRISVSDGQESASLSAFDIMVVAASEPNQPPTISGTPSGGIKVGKEYWFKPTAVDVDGDSLIFSIANKPDWATFSADDGRLSGIPAPGDTGNYPEIQIKVSDGNSMAALPSFSIWVSTATLANQPPSIWGSAPKIINIDSNYNFTPGASDPDGDNLSFTIANKPAWALFNENDGSISGKPTQENAGITAGIVITVNDGNETVSLPAFNIEVKAAAVNARRFHPGHYFSANPWDTDADKLQALSQPGVVGLQVRYQWRKIEAGFDTYDFSAIQADLDLVKSQGKQLVIFIEDKTFFDEKPTPQYLHANHTLPNDHGGWTALRWHPYVIERFTKLFSEIGNRFDSEPALEGVAIQESEPGFYKETRDANGYTPEIYRDALITVLLSMAESLPSTQVMWYMNFLPERMAYLLEVANAVAPAGVAAGGPDILPDDYALSRLVYPYYKELRGKITLFNSMQYNSFNHVHKDTSYPTKYWTPEELILFARDELFVSYIFWNRKTYREPADSYMWTDALPAMQKRAKFYE